jgi:hypothetical protein
LVLGVEGESLGVGGVRLVELDLGDQVLVEEELADVRNLTTGKSVVGQDGGIQGGQDVNVGGTASVVAREGADELGNSVLVGADETAAEGIVKVGGVAAVTVAAGYDTGVHSSAVAVPEVKVDIGKNRAGVDINDLDVGINVNTLLVLTDVLTDELSVDVYRLN